MKNSTSGVPKTIAAVHDISCYGRCSMQAVWPVLSHYGHLVCPLPTALLSTHTGGFDHFTFLDLSSEMENILDSWRGEDIRFDAVYSGFLGSARQIGTVLSLIGSQSGALVLVDPVMGDNGEIYKTYTSEMCELMHRLCARADIITPNLTEACLLADMDYGDVCAAENYREVLDKLKKLCPRPSVTGCDVADGKGTRSAVFYTDGNGKDKVYSTEKIGGAFHGAGDVYASALVGCLARGVREDDAVKLAADFTKNSIAQTKKDGTEARYGLNSESCMYAFLRALDGAAK